MGWVLAFVILETSRGKAILADTTWETRLEKRPAVPTVENEAQTGTR